MAGRGRGATLPAWLTAAENNGNDFTPVVTAPSSFIYYRHQSPSVKRNKRSAVGTHFFCHTDEYRR